MTQSVVVESLRRVNLRACVCVCACWTNLICFDSWASLSACICDTFPLCVCTQSKRWRQRANETEWLLTEEHRMSTTIWDRVTKLFWAGPPVTVEFIYWQYYMWHSYIPQRLNYDFLIQRHAAPLLLSVTQAEHREEQTLNFLKSTHNQIYGHVLISTVQRFYYTYQLTFVLRVLRFAF